MKQQQKILILGGTNFMGKALLDALGQVEPNPIVVCVNRGKIYWNNQARKQHPQVLHFYCDRKEHKDTTATVNFISKHLKINQHHPWDCVVDFSAFRWRDVQSVTKAIANTAKKYIFISSDSVYNNSSQKLRNPIRENDFNLQEQYRILKASDKSKDNYGYNKMKCEIYLNRVKPLPFVCLRLPDVIGPYDNTERFWCTVKWIRECHTYPLQITADEQTEKLSFVDSLSVASQIIKLINMDYLPSNTYNICSLESVTLKQFLQLIWKSIGSNNELIYKAERNKSSNHFYPSVQCGAISCERAVKEIGWNPLPIAQSIRQSVDFFTYRAMDYGDERKEMQKQFKKKIVQKSN